jgi:predicted glycoside hydrolase/deacetylase ChbG (UPF0249 family)
MHIDAAVNDLHIADDADQSSGTNGEQIRKGSLAQRGKLIINADDWGRNQETTDRIFECIRHRTVSSASAMVFMEDSERAAEIAREKAVDTGLHVNFTTDFSERNVPSLLKDKQQRISAYLRRRRLNQAIFHPGLRGAFEYVMAAQLQEYTRLYGDRPARIDGHHHMHLCANAVLARLLPSGTIVRRNFSFQPGEKSVVNRIYRKTLDAMLARRHRLTDYFFSLPPLEPQNRLERIIALARKFEVEVETHPVNTDEYRFLTGEGVDRWAGTVQIAANFIVRLREGS